MTYEEQVLADQCSLFLWAGSRTVATGPCRHSAHHAVIRRVSRPLHTHDTAFALSRE